MINLELDTQRFYSWFDRISENVKLMVPDVLRDSADTFFNKNYYEVPVRQGYLRRSFQYSIADIGDFYEMEFGYTGRYNPDAKYDYALEQEVIPYHHEIGGHWLYLEGSLGMMNEIVFKQLDKDYLSCFNVPL